MRLSFRGAALASILCCAAAAWPPQRARADDVPRAASPRDALAECVSPAIAAAQRQGARAERDQQVGFLREGENHSVEIVLGADGCVGFLAIGHRRARDLDMYLHTESGMALVRDVALDAHPYVRFCGARGLRLYLTLRMVAGQGEYRLVRFTNAPLRISDLERLLESCAAPPTGAVPSSADVGPEPPGATLDEALASMVARMGESGYRPRGNPVRGRIAPSSSDPQTIRFEAGRCAAVVSVGGPEAIDVDLLARGPLGDPLAQDTSRDRNAVIKLCPPQTMDVVLETRMYRGSGEYALQAFSIDDPPATTRAPGILGTTRILHAEIVARMARRGMIAEPLAWGLAEPDDTLAMPVELRAGECYAFGAVPAPELGLGDLDLMLVDDRGALLAWDVGAGSTPLVFHCATRTGVARVVGRVYGAEGRYLVMKGRAR